MKQATHYYHYGDILSQSTNHGVQKFKYNGKEMDRMYGLDTYDHGARQYNPARITWDRMDQYAEKYYHLNPYLYCAGNPVRFIDPDGRAPGDFFSTMNAAAIDFGKYYNDNSIREGREYASNILQVKNEDGQTGYTYTVATIGASDNVKIETNSLGSNKTVANIHTHGKYDFDSGIENNIFSGSNNLSADKRTKVQSNDLGVYNKFGKDGYLVCPDGSLKKYSHKTGKISVISNEMPSDQNDPKRLNNLGVEEHNPINVVSLTKAQNNIIKLITNSIFILDE